MNGRTVRRRREIERTLGMRIHDAASARAAAVALAAMLNADADVFGVEPMTDIGRALLHDQMRKLVGLPPIKTPP